MLSESKAQAKFMEEMYDNPQLAKQRGMDHKMIREWVDADRAKGIKNLPERKGIKTNRSKKRK